MSGWLLTASLSAAVTTPKEFFGFEIGDDYKLTTYTQAEAYLKKITADSKRAKLVEIGKTEEGRSQWMVIVSSPENMTKLARFKEISQKLGRAEGLDDQQARALAEEGKAIVWIDGGLHATETVGAHQLIQMVYNFISRDDPETLRILDNVVILFTHCNPDGQELVSSWYMRNEEPKMRSFDDIPRLYQKYIGHDNNRDFFMMNMKETQNMSRQLYVEWIPQIVYNHHQTAPAGAVVAGPPYRDPVNHVYDPLLITSIDAVGAAMNNRLNVEGKPGYTQRTGSVFSTWWNGGLRTTPYFHNMVGILTEITGNPTPMTIPLVPNRLVPSGATPNPVAPQSWHFRQSIDYSVSLNYGVLDYAARNRDQLLFNIYRMGKDAIERGSGDFWTAYPSRIAAITAAYEKDKASSGDTMPAPTGRFAAAVPVKYYDQVMKNPSLRDARGYILPSDQPDFPTVTRFMNALLLSGVRVEKASMEFSVGGKTYPAGSYIVKTDQAFRPHVIDMFEPQDHPNDFQYPGGPPIAPYDSAGWTLAYEMGVKFDRILEGFTGPFERVPYGELQTPLSGKINGSGPGYVVSFSANNTTILVNRLLKAGVEAYWLDGSADTAPSLYVAAEGKPIIEQAVKSLGLNASAVASKPAGASRKLSPVRIALWDRYGGSMPSGWTRWLLEQFEFASVTVVYPKDIDAGKLREKFDAVVFVTGAIPRSSAGGEAPEFTFNRQPKPEAIPEEWRDRLGALTASKSIPVLKEFLAEGGTVITIGTSTNLAYHLGLPVSNALTEFSRDGVSRALPHDKYYIPGSILRATVDATRPVAAGMTSSVDVYFDESPVFKLAPEASEKGVKPLLWFSTPTPLRSGWAWGQAYLNGGVAAFEAPVGKGKLYAFGPEIIFRAQTYGTYKLFFNGLVLSTAQPVN